MTGRNSSLIFQRAGLCFGALLLLSFSSAMASTHLVFFGTYTKSTSRGIYAAQFDDESGTFTAPRLVAETQNPTWLVLTPNHRFLYAVHPSKAQAIGYRVTGTDGTLTPLPLSAEAGKPAAAPSHLAVDSTGRALLAANYHDGYVASILIRSDGTLGAPDVIRHEGHGPNPTRQQSPHVHCVVPSPDNRFVLVCDLGLDRIFAYALDPANARLTPATPPFVVGAPGSGPRHVTFSPDGRRVYEITEMGATVVGYDYDAARGRLTEFQTVSTLPADFNGEKWAAEVHVHPNGKFLYASNRGHDSIAVFAIAPVTGRLSPIEIVPSGGKVPRDFTLSADGRWLICGHQESDRVTVFKVDPATGRLGLTPHAAKLAMCVCVLFCD